MVVEVERVREDDVEELVNDLWFSLAKEREDDHRYNELAEDGLISSSLDHKREKLDEEGSEIYVAKDSGEMVGFISLSVSERPPIFKIKDELSVTELFVKKSHRGEGIGKKLMEKAEEYGDKKGCGFVSLSVDIPNEESYGFYQHLGFKQYRRRMAKDL